MVELRVTTRDDGTTRYRVMTDGGVSPSGVAWELVVSTSDKEANRTATEKMNEVAQAFGYVPPSSPAPAPPPKPNVTAKKEKNFWSKS